MKSPFFSLLVVAATSILLLHTSLAGAASEKVLYSFCSQPGCADGALPWGGVFPLKGKLYVTAKGGGQNQWGTMVSVDKRTGAATVLYSFESEFADAATPISALIDANGTLYGMTEEGGAGGAGTIYGFDPKSKKLNVSHSFCLQPNCTDGALPLSSLIAVNGMFYGTTDVGGSHTTGCYGPYPGCGTVFSFDPGRGKAKVLYSFCKRQACSDGSRPAGDLIDVDGVLYGTASEGGNGSGCSDMGEGCGVVFALDPATLRETVLHTFEGIQDGGTPTTGMIYLNGLLYGTTRYGGGYASCHDYQSGCGTVFSVDPASGAETVLHSFAADGTDGQYPHGDLMAVNGVLYGVTQFGGAHDSGAVFAINLATGKEKVVYSFCAQPNCPDGANPAGPLVQIGRSLYGTTETGGTGNEPAGTVFSIRP